MGIFARTQLGGTLIFLSRVSAALRPGKLAIALIAKPGMVYPEGTTVTLTRPSGSGKLAQNSKGPGNPGFALVNFVATVAGVRSTALSGLDGGPRLHLIFCGRNAAGEIADEVVPAAAHHVLRGGTVAVRNVRDHEKIEVLVGFDQRIDDQ